MVLFLFAALSFARANCDDFTIDANALVTGTSPNFATTTMFGENLALFIRPDHPVGYTFSWVLDDIVMLTGLSYTPTISTNPEFGASIVRTFVVECREFNELKNSKNITVTVTHRTSHAVNFDTDGGMPSVNSQTVLLGSTATRPTTTVTKLGYDFVDWDFNFSTPIWEPITIKAIWTPKKYTINFIAQGGAVDPTSIEVLYDTEIPALPTPTRPGYAFNGWFSAATSGNKFTATVYTFTENQTLYAQWEPNIYTITFDPQSGSVNPASKNVTFGSVVGDLPTPERIGYDFEGWFTEANGSGTRYTAATSYSIASSITLYAHWRIKTFTVSFINIDLPIQPQTVAYEQKATRPSQIPERVGHTFVNWEFDFDNTLIRENTAIRAVWEANIYTVTFANIDVPITPQLIEYNKNATKPSDPERTGYDFFGWDFIFSTPITKDTVIEAIWVPKQYRIIFNPEGGTVLLASINVTYKEAIGTLPMPRRDAHNFLGWFTEKDGQGDEIKTGDIYEHTDDLNAYAHWIFVQGTIPTLAMLEYALLSTNLIYDCNEKINPVSIMQRNTVTGSLGKITPLYNNSPNFPIDAGVYQISAAIEESEDYAPATIPLGISIVVGKATTTLEIINAVVGDKIYDATRTAIISEIEARATLHCEEISRSDYIVSANFESPNVGTNIHVDVRVSQNPEGPLFKNYILEPNAFEATANISRATGVLIIKAPENYTLSDPTRPTIVDKNSFIREADITWEYRREANNQEYSRRLPNRVGEWEVRGSFPDCENGNYTGAMDSDFFLVTRGDSIIARDSTKMTFGTVELKEDPLLSTKLQEYFVLGLESCEVQDEIINIQVTVKEPDLVLKVNGIPQAHDECEDEENCSVRHFINYKFGNLKPGLDTIAYTLESRFSYDNYKETNLILIERPIPFEDVVIKKWNNTLVVNNNLKTNGNYNFTNFKWFKNGSAIGIADTLQFYSAGPSHTDTLKASDKYTVQMYYAINENLFRISTCENSEPTPPVAAPKSLQKRVLGIGNTPPAGKKIYNIRGERTSGEAAGVYIVED
jgi:uncharacterized repeat protein (TIGR02543 family)